MKLLHLCCNYAGSGLYRELFEKIHRPGIGQVVYVPVRRKMEIGMNASDLVPVTYSPLLKKWHRVLYKCKINALAKDIQCRFDMQHMSVVHAHTLFSDGGVAYLLNKKYGTRYLVTIRNTDLNVFMKWKPYLIPFACKIMANAERVIFISRAYQKSFLNKLPARSRGEIQCKSTVIANGVHPFWLDHRVEFKKKPQPGKLNLIQIGKLSKNKNVSTSIKVVSALNKNGMDVKLKLVGEGRQKKKLYELCKSLAVVERVVFHGYVQEKTILRDLLRASDVLLMPSRAETFGLVLLEAMSQGLPVVYTKGEGFDGNFEEGRVGFSVKWNDINGITDAVKKIIEDYMAMSKNCIGEVQNFNWNQIACQFVTIYQGN